MPVKYTRLISLDLHNKSRYHTRHYKLLQEDNMNFHRQAKQNIAERKSRAEFRAESLLNELRADPTFFDLESRQIEIWIQMAKMYSQTTEKGALTEELNRIKNLISSRIIELGHDPKELEPQYICKICKDTGYINDEECVCLKQEKYRLIKENENFFITDKCSFSDVSVDSLPDENKRSLTAAYGLLNKFIGAFPEAHKSHIITLLGTVGCGKTFAASVVANAIIDKGYTSLLIPSFKLADIFSRYHFAYESEKPYILDEIYDVDVLIIDDLGTEEIRGDFLPGYLYQLLCNRANQYTLITTNLKMDAIHDRYGVRVHSRMSDISCAKVIELNGKDLRIHSKNN